MKSFIYTIAMVLLLFMIGCEKTVVNDNSKPIVTTTTSFIADIVKQVGGDFVQVEMLMPPGIDPHQYKASERDIIKIASSKIVFHNGLHLEGKLGQLFERTEGAVLAYAVTDYIPKDQLISLGDKLYDPHVWFDPNLWIYAVNRVADGLVKIDPANEIYYRKNEEIYIKELRDLYADVIKQMESVPQEKRVLITSHDAFAYFGRAYGWRVIGVQGINTASETSVYDLNNLAKYIVENNINAVFTETSVSSRSVDALIQSVKALGGDLQKGAPLYSDSTGPAGSPAATYFGTIQSNVDNILKLVNNNQNSNRSSK